MTMHGYLRFWIFITLYLGPMYSGKTSKLLELYKQYAFCNINTIVS